MIPVVELRGISKSFLTDEVETRALRDVSLTIRGGEFVAVTGPSGCGKTTLLSLMGLLEPPSAGEYALNGRSVAELSRRELARARNRDVGIIFQGFNLLGDMTVEENVALPLTFDDMPKKQISGLVEEALRRVNMTHRARHYPRQLSGGQQQRVAVARAVARRPALLLADEPTGNLDSTSGVAVLDLLCQLHEQGSTICMVTHNAQHAARAGRVVAMRDGQVVPDGPEIGSA